MMIIGLTGSIASGKSTIGRVFHRYHFPVFDSDKAVHHLLGPKGAAVGDILAQFGDCGTYESGMDRKKLGSHVFANPEALSTLESILHPLVGQKRARFLQQAKLARRRAIILDVPLLFETKTDLICDKTILAMAPDRLIRQRALARSGMTDDKLNGILAKQMSQFEKAKLADEIITTGLGHGAMMRDIHRLLSKWRLR